MLKKSKVLMLTGVLAATSLFAAACGVQEATKPAQTGAPAAAEAPKDPRDAWPKVLRVGSIPGEDQETVSRRLGKLTEDMGKELGIKVEFFVGSDYTATIEAMRAKKLDIASFGPFAYILANERSGAMAMAVGAASPEAAFYTSQIIVPAKSNIQKLSDLKGKKFLFVDPASASGHLFPRSYLVSELGIKNEEMDKFFGNLSFSGGHDASILAIARGDADGAAVASSILSRLITQKLVKEEDIRIIGTSKPIPSSPVSYRKDLPADLVEKIKTFYTTYKNEELFKELKITGYYPVDDKQYDVVRDTAKALGMSPEQLLK